jgi:hypothetical protein
VDREITGDVIKDETGYYNFYSSWKLELLEENSKFKKLTEISRKFPGIAFHGVRLLTADRS